MMSKEQWMKWKLFFELCKKDFRNDKERVKRKRERGRKRDKRKKERDEGMTGVVSKWWWCWW